MMFDVISTADTTEWHSFPDLNTKCSYSHVANGTVDFQVIPNRNYFALFNRKFGLEFLRTVIKDATNDIQRIKKRQINDLVCGAISKIHGSELALGMSSGVIRLFSIKSGQYTPFKYRPDIIGNSVITLDYSNNDEYLAAAYESGDINLYALKAGLKTNIFHCDEG